MTLSRHILGILALVGFCVAPAPGAWSASLESESLGELRQRLQGEWLQSDKEWSSQQTKPFSVYADVKSDINVSESRFQLQGVNFDSLRQYLSEARNWCEIMLLHLNVKSCVHRQDEGSEMLDLYLGRKYAQTPGESTRIDFQFYSRGADDVFQARLHADQGPYGTSDYRFELNAIPAGEQVFVKLRLSNRVGYAEKLADVYLNTLGRFKVGFTYVGKDLFGRPKFVKGRLGAAERNVVRYMLALETALSDTDADFMVWAGRWFEATEEYPKQLREMARKDYMSVKTTELENQERLQSATDRNETISFKPEVEFNK